MKSFVAVKICFILCKLFKILMDLLFSYSLNMIKEWNYFKMPGEMQKLIE